MGDNAGVQNVHLRYLVLSAELAHERARDKIAALETELAALKGAAPAAAPSLGHQVAAFADRWASRKVDGR